jgi:hypothetical protein
MGRDGVGLVKLLNVQEMKVGSGASSSLGQVGFYIWYFWQKV